MTRCRKYTFSEQIEDVKFMKSWAETRGHIWYPWSPRWDQDRAKLHAWHVVPGMDRQMRKHFTEEKI